METNAVLFAKWLFCLVLYSFCAVEIAHHTPVSTTLSLYSSTQTKQIAPFKSVITKGNKSSPKENVNNFSRATTSILSKQFAGNYTIPVVVHIINQNPDAVTDQQIIDAIKDLNDAFAHTGIYAVGPGANIGITFCLAKTDPDGGITNGITRTKSVLSDFDQDVEDARLKNLVSWDTKQFCNIWYVEGIKSEILTTFSCSQWARQHEDGYAGLSGDGDYRDGIVVASFGTLLAHEMGHYLGLKHIFEGGCSNADCNVNGDGICDTPPQGSMGGSCTAPQNSCSSDTVSGFTVDVPDLNSNFMSYSGACTNEFTAGQGAKMRNVIDNVRNSLTAQNKCNPPCAENTQAKFTRNNWFPAVGDNITFTSTSTGGTNYQWSVDGVIVGGNGATYTQSFAAPGKYKVSLKVYNANQNCFAIYTDFVIVTCGVMARFFPDKRIIASTAPFLLDSILFTNRSVNGYSYKWLMSNDQGMAEQVVSMSTDLNYVFAKPGQYSIRLIATNGSCSDTTQKFDFSVVDATPDGTMAITRIDCFQQTKIKLSISICNNGYGSIPPNSPVTFYDADPRSGSANKIGETFFIPDTIKGRCCYRAYEDTIDANRVGTAQLYAVFNDNGSTIPLVFPNTGISEKTYDNNVAVSDNFQFKATANPPTATLEPGDSLQLSAQAGPGNVASFIWASAENISCTNCNNPLFIAGKKDIVKEVIATSEYGCIDSAFVDIKILPADDFVINIDSINCSRNDSMLINFTICNNFKRGTIPTDLKVAFYDGDPATSSAHLLGPVFISDADYPGKCNSYQHLVKKIEAGKVFSVVNDNGINIPVQLPDDSVNLEKDYTNNTADFDYQQDTVSLLPADTAIVANQSISIRIGSPVYNASSIQWFPGDGYTLSCTNCNSPVAKIKFNSTVNMKMENQYGCIIKGESRIKTYTGGIVNIPNGFTPNTDGHNDVFYIRGSNDIRILKDFSIFNRWGQKVFQVNEVPANDPNFGWKGFVNGKQADAGTYVYFVKVSFTDGTEQLYKGTVTLIR